jgi:hypothetical protein
MTNSPEFSSWKSLKERCMNETSKDYPRYGGRGIKVCERWQKFENFYADMGPRPSPEHTIDRKDNNGPYEPRNCRWATLEEQGNNKRNNVRLSFGGATKTVAQWSREIGIPYDVIHHRLRSGWSVDAALTRPVRQRSSPNMVGPKP